MILTEKQEQRLEQIKEREENIQNVITTAIVNRNQKLPLGLMLESRFNMLVKEGIMVEGRIASAKENDESLVPTLEKRLSHVKGSISEVQNIADMIAEFNAFGREFDTSTLKQKENDSN